MKFVFKLLKWLLIAVFSIVLVITILNFVPFSASSVTQENKFRKTDRPFIIPHGGAKDLAPENTVYSYDMLINDYDADVLEIDLSLTKDDILISHHNLDLELS